MEQKAEKKVDPLSLPACWSWDTVHSCHWNSIGSPESSICSFNSVELQTPLEARENPETRELHCPVSQDIYKVLLALSPLRTLAKMLPPKTAYKPCHIATSHTAYRLGGGGGSAHNFPLQLHLSKHVPHSAFFLAFRWKDRSSLS